MKAQKNLANEDISSMMVDMTEDLIIIGAGCAGFTAAIYASRASLNPLLFTGSQIGGQLTTTTEVENFPGFPEGIMGPELMYQMQQQAEKFGTRFAYEDIQSVTKDAEGIFHISTTTNNYQARSVIVATGATARYLGLDGEKALVGHGLTACATCDGSFYRDVPVCVVGGGDSACEEAAFLTRFASKVYLIHRRDSLRASKIMADRTLANPKITPVWNSTISAYQTDEKRELSSVTLQNLETKEESPLEVKCVFMAIGHTPNSKFLGDLVDRDPAGYIMRIGSSTSTKTAGLFAAGDVADPLYRQAISSAGMGCGAAIEAERYLME